MEGTPNGRKKEKQGQATFVDSWKLHMKGRSGWPRSIRAFPGPHDEGTRLGVSVLQCLRRRNLFIVQTVHEGHQITGRVS